MTTYDDIYKDNSQTRTALKGLTGRLARHFERFGIPLSQKTLQRQGESYKPEIGAGFVNRTRVLLLGFKAIGATARAKMILGGFTGIFEDKPLFAYPIWMQKVFVLIGELQAVLISGDRRLLDIKRFELSELLTAEIAG